MKYFTLTSLLSATLLSFPLASVAQGWGSWQNELTVWESVHQTLHLYPIIIDRQEWSLLPQLFTPDATANYTGFQPYAAGIPAIQAGLINAVKTFTTQHLFGTTLIDVAADGQSANSTIYVQATLFLNPQASAGQVAYVYAYYADHLVLTSAGWRIDARIFALQKPGLAGNLTILGL